MVNLLEMLLQKNLITQKKSLNEQLELKFLKNTASYILQKILRLEEVDRNRESIGLLFYITKMLLILTAGMLFIG